jgi:hypothetical protein
MSKQSDRNILARVHYASLFAKVDEWKLPSSLASEFSDERIRIAARGMAPTADGQFCQRIRKIASGLHLALSSAPVSEKAVRKELERILRLTQT